MSHNDLYQDIPEEFFSFETNKPFERCIECDAYLLDGREYMIEKAYRKYKGFSAVDTVFDYAICVECATKMRNEFSRESLRRIDNYFQTGIQFSKFLHKSDEKLDIKACLGSCIIKDHRIEDLEEYQTYAYCHGDKIYKGVPPYLVGGPAIDEVLELVSNPTMDFLNGFYNKHFSPDPSLMNPTPSPKLVFV